MNLLKISSLLVILSLLCVGGQRIQGNIPDRPILYPDDDGRVSFCPAFGTQRGVCKDIQNCNFHFASPEEMTQSICQRKDGAAGVCCPLITIDEKPTGRVIEPGSRSIEMPEITTNDINDSGKEGINYLQKVALLEKELSRRGLTIKSGTSAAFHQAFFGNKDTARQLGKRGQVNLETTIDILKRFNLNPEQGRDGLVHFDLSNSDIGGICIGKPSCPKTKYRSMDGSCNNLRNTTWGKSFTPFQRFMLPRYADGVNLPRIASDGGPLPSPRKVSSMSTPDANVPHNYYALIIMQWAQFLDHDMTVAAISKANDGEGIKCCDEEIRRNPRLRHPECMEIPIPTEDKFFSKFDQTCMEFVRSAPAPRESCKLGPREQMNQLTAFLDGSQIYGSTHEEANNLRSFRGGRLRALNFNSVELLPRETNRSQECAQRQTDLFCFMAGDERVNEQNGLTTMHTIWLREHNRIASELEELNPHWPDDLLFLETRRIVGAEIQHITYNEFLPLLVGRRMMRSFGLLLKKNGHSTSYDPSLNPSIANGFATAAYRYGHTLVQGNFHLMEEDGTVSKTVPLHTQFFNPILIYQPGNLDRYIRGLTRQPAQTYDSFVTDKLTNHLFEIPGRGFGLDLIALNIQRGRDHAIPSYNAWRDHCGLKKMTSFQDLTEVMSAQSANTFSALYRNVDDIDLFPAGIAETPLPDATLGPTFACIVTEQFRRLKYGDRFFYDNGGMDTSFSESQLNELRKANLARIICDNSDNIGFIQAMVFFLPNDSWNPMVSCSESQISKVNLEAWKNEPVF